MRQARNEQHGDGRRVRLVSPDLLESGKAVLKRLSLNDVAAAIRAMQDFTVTYQATDGELNSNTATLTISVSAVNANSTATGR